MLASNEGVMKPEVRELVRMVEAIQSSQISMDKDNPVSTNLTLTGNGPRPIHRDCQVLGAPAVVLLRGHVRVIVIENGSV
jgi:predicted TIM-barrel enzyme